MRRGTAEDAVPVISRFKGIAIRMHFNDHAPPHFHASCSSSEARIEIATGRLMSSSLPPKARRSVLKWLELHRAELALNWELAASRKPLNRIDPLE